ncbi:glycogen phosphorylase [Thiomicrospira aerophila AL3]|uniref:Alpha-1,4 glucan phosphorylase n=1 Tax=Thiomicrospira aerophila AL3 TaxID=717772 RepID=W0DY31_9GAMM|nr:glycogen/starch/alpha-glucan phosphorylase [Thiomicrospira aerophila]AHF01761.1 glycogen phosphorylase [Thiomicrospira aerophila AL3]
MVIKTTKAPSKAKKSAVKQPALPNDKVGLEHAFLHYLENNLGRDLPSSPEYQLAALSYVVRDRLMQNWKKTWQTYNENPTKRAYYLSMEFLMGRSLRNNLLNLGLEGSVKEALTELSLAYENIEQQEIDAGLGNGGLGRLAACFVDSCATLGLPVMGYGLRYEYGMFRQLIEQGFQIEAPDHWLGHGDYPWESQRREYARTIKFGGYCHIHELESGELRVHWEHAEEILAVPFDVPVPGYKNHVVNSLRLWHAEAPDAFKLSAFNAGSYFEAVAEKQAAENLTMVLYPNDSSENGKELRLRQQYFLVSASLQDVVAQWTYSHGDDFTDFAKFNVFQLNDTHPSLAVAELMRLLVDEHHLSWEQAWSITTQTMAYTNHTLLPEALEKWSRHLMARLLPRPLQIIEEINRRFLIEVASKWPGCADKIRELSLFDEHGMVRMAYLAIVGSFSVNGVAALHSELLKEGLFNDFYQLWPHKFNNKTNGVTQRRWLAACNPGLRGLITETLGNEDWITDLNQLSALEQQVDNPAFQQAWFETKQANKQRLADLIAKEVGVNVSTNALFDVQVKRIHEYKRQLLNALHAIHLYRQLKMGATQNWTNRVIIFGGKAAPGYAMAKTIIKLINNIAMMVNNDPDIGDKLKVVFIPNYRVSTMEVICPAADLSEQISTAGKEASGTGNMKFMMNGAITIGTLDGANVEIREAVGDDNFFLFGLRAHEVQTKLGEYYPQHYIDTDADLAGVVELLRSGHFNPLEPGLFDGLIGSFMAAHDPWMTLADFRSYVDAQARVAQAYQDQQAWVKMSIVNSARSGMFSTDRTMQQYNDDIWHLTPVKVD